MAALLLFLGLLLIVVGGLMLLVAMFCVSVWWGIGGLVFPIIQIVFIFKYWRESRLAIIVQTIGFLLLLGAMLVGGEQFNDAYKQQFYRYMRQAAPEQMRELDEMQAMGILPDMGMNPDQNTSAKPVKTTQPAGNAAQVQGENGSAAAATQPVVPAEDIGAKKIHKCVDAKGRVAYTEQPCAGAEEKKVITIRETDDSPLGNATGNVLDKVKKIVGPDSGK